MTPEKELQRLILEWARAQPRIRLWRNRSAEAARNERLNPTRRKERNGSPDLEGWIDGWYLGIEVKDATSKPTHEQALWIAEAVSQGACSFVARSLDGVIEEVRVFRLEKKKGRA